MKLSILTPYIRRHEAFFHKLRFEFYRQMLPYEDGQVEFLSDNHEYDTIGVKRNRLLERATGEYLCFFDADDQPSENYIDLLMGAIETGCDCASLLGVYTVNGSFDGIFEHSLKYNEWRTTDNNIKYERYPNHLNCIKADIAKRFKFPEKNFSEDYDWSKQIHEAGALNTEHYIPSIIYNYNYLSNKK
jgi:glycosyltransferase involved in cell wall biosynthesis